jgi:hypothetical protein
MVFLGTAYKSPKLMVVRAKVANVRAKPVEHSGRYELDPFQNTQVEEGEAVWVLEESHGWARVQCTDQLIYNYTKHRWEGCPGWVRASLLTSDLNKMKKLVRHELPVEQLRKIVILKAAQHLDTMYLWGGCSLFDPDNTETATGVDCSGLVNWSYRWIGLITPRDANDQHTKARVIKKSNELQPGDLVFIASAYKRKEVRHVLIYTGGEEMIEAPKSGEFVRRITFQEKIGLPLVKLRNGLRVGDKVVYFGTLFEGGK